MAKVEFKCDFVSQGCCSSLGDEVTPKVGDVVAYGMSKGMINGKCKFEHPEFNPVCNDYFFYCITDSENSVTMPISCTDVSTDLVTVVLNKQPKQLV